MKRVVIEGIAATLQMFQPPLLWSVFILLIYHQSPS